MTSQNFRHSEQITILRGRRDFLKLGAAFAAVPMLGGAASGVSASESGAGGGSGRMVVTPSGERDSFVGPSDYITGSVVVEMLFRPEEPARTSGASVTFAPGARSHWHTHPLGQILVVTAGVGWLQQEGRERQEIRPGDVAWIPPDIRHWHGATATNAMTHLAIQEVLDGTNVVWLDPVTDAQYEM